MQDVRGVKVECCGRAVACDGQAVPLAPLRRRASSVRNLARMVVTVRAVLKSLDNRILAVHRTDLQHQHPIGVCAENRPLFVPSLRDRRFRVHDHHFERECPVLQRAERERRRGDNVPAAIGDPGVGREVGSVDACGRVVAGQIRPLGRRGVMHAHAAVLDRVKVSDQAVLHVERGGWADGRTRDDPRRGVRRERHRTPRDGRADGKRIEENVG